jgi:hypothetical protein
VYQFEYFKEINSKIFLDLGVATEKSFCFLSFSKSTIDGLWESSNRGFFTQGLSASQKDKWDVMILGRWRKSKEGRGIWNRLRKIQSNS